jgi:hypothetical protein
MNLGPAVFPQEDREEKGSAASVKRSIGRLARAGSTIILQRSRRQAGSSFFIEPIIIS